LAVPSRFPADRERAASCGSAPEYRECGMVPKRSRHILARTLLNPHSYPLKEKGHAMTCLRTHTSTLISLLLAGCLAGCSKSEAPLREGMVKITVQGMRNLRDTAMTRTYHSDSLRIVIKNNVIEAYSMWSKPLTFTVNPTHYFGPSNRQLSLEHTDMASILDRDGDGIADNEDACPDTPGLGSDDASASGCPVTDSKWDTTHQVGPSILVGELPLPDPAHLGSALIQPEPQPYVKEK